MSILKRACCYITRKKLKSFVMFAILLCMSTAMLSGIAIQKSTARTSREMNRKLTAGFVVENNRLSINVPNIVTKKDVEAIKKIKGITSSAKKMGVHGKLENAKLVPLATFSEYDESVAKTYGQVLTVYGTDNSVLDNQFLSDALTLTEGRHLTEKDTKKAIVHEDFASYNHLKIGDTIRLNADVPSNPKPSAESVEVEIIGLFSGKNPQAVTSNSELAENVFLTDLTTTQILCGTSPETEAYGETVFFVKNEKELNSIMEQVKKLPLQWEHYDMRKSSQLFSGLSASVNAVNRLVTTMLVFTFAFSVIILSLILFLWTHERRKETGILLAVGTPKYKIVLQYLAELMIIAILSFGISYFSGQTAAQSISNKMTAQAAKSVEEDIRSQLGGLSLGADMESGMTSKTLQKVDVEIKPEYLLTVSFIGMSVIVISVGIASIPLLRKKPKELLTQIS